MEDKLRKYVDNLFNTATPTKKSVELKEEMIQNLHDKYNDVITDGKSEEAAYNIAVAGIGDVSGLLADLEADVIYNIPDRIEMETARRKSAMLTSVAVVMYIVSFLPALIMSEFRSSYVDSIGLPLALLICAAATGLLVYNSMTKPKFTKTADSMVEEFKQWQSDEKDRRSMRRAISAALWSIILALYFIISFWSGAWHMTWICFLIGIVIETLLNIFFAMKKHGKNGL